ncbi:MAG TPA: M28 family peptidase [Candidatus Hydrogenedentes bacterium]|nr:M28 family peptidase [Candidatus Hydrogenedentota bacterium]
MSVPELRRDMEYLTGVLPHRGSNTRSERSAAEYLAQRFKQFTLDVEIDDFHSIDSEWLLYASYYAEFTLVAILAVWWPYIAFGYGLTVFLCYLAEFTGYRVLGRLLPQYESQNVICRFIAPKPRRLFIVTAHYDSPKNSAFQDTRVQPWLRSVHLFLVLCMVVVVVSCVVQGLGILDSLDFAYEVAIRWTAVGCLLGVAAFLAFSELTSDYGRGAWDNASGASVLVELARRFQVSGLSQADLWLVATGSKEAGLNGMRHFMSTHKLDRANTFFLNLDAVGAANLHYITAEGLLSTFGSSKTMLSAAESAAKQINAAPSFHRELPSDALIPLARGFHALTLTSSYENPPDDRLLSDDTHLDVRDDALLAASAFAEDILRRLDRELGAEQ